MASTDVGYSTTSSRSVRETVAARCRHRPLRHAFPLALPRTRHSLSHHPEASTQLFGAHPLNLDAHVQPSLQPSMQHSSHRRSGTEKKLSPTDLLVNRIVDGRRESDAGTGLPAQSIFFPAAPARLVLAALDAVGIPRRTRHQIQTIAYMNSKVAIIIHGDEKPEHPFECIPPSLPPPLFTPSPPPHQPDPSLPAFLLGTLQQKQLRVKHTLEPTSLAQDEPRTMSSDRHPRRRHLRCTACQPTGRGLDGI